MIIYIKRVFSGSEVRKKYYFDWIVILRYRMFCYITAKDFFFFISLHIFIGTNEGNQRLVPLGELAQHCLIHSAPFALLLLLLLLNMPIFSIAIDLWRITWIYSLYLCDEMSFPIFSIFSFQHLLFFPQIMPDQIFFNACLWSVCSFFFLKIFSIIFCYKDIGPSMIAHNLKCTKQN